MVVYFIIGILLTIAAFSKASQDIITHKFSWSVYRNLDEDWWDPTFSWRNKYKYKNPSLGERFFGSTTFMVFLTDAWHMFQWLHNLSLWIGLALLGWQSQYLMGYGFILMLIFARVYYGVVFQIFYSKTLED